MWYFVPLRMVVIWNVMPELKLVASTVTTFKYLDAHLHCQETQGDGPNAGT